MRTILFAICLCLARVAAAQQFELQAADGKVSGPFLLRDGHEVTIGATRARIVNIVSHYDELLNSMEHIVIPRVDFRAARLEDVVAFLREASVEHDPTRRGINIVLNIPRERRRSSTWAAEGAGLPLVTFAAGEIDLLQALQTVARVAGLKLRIIDGVVELSPREPPDGEIARRPYLTGDVMPMGPQLVVFNESQYLRLEQFFEDLGVSWPIGSSISFNYELGALMVANTPANLDRIERHLSWLDLLPSLIEVEVQYVAFELDAIQRLARDDLNVESLMTLWTEGHGKLLAAPRVVTQSGAKATARGVTECIYPTQFRICHVAGTNTNTTVVAPIVEPDGFETRETGAILEVIPETGTGGIIHLNLTPELCEGPVWQDFGGVYVDSNGREQQASMPQPYFHTYRVESIVAILDGQRALIGGGMPSRDGKSVIYTFVTARKVSVQGGTGGMVREAP